ncbi:MAG TPA: glutaredoxin family protein [Burkholderiaceae bacterium]|nr:glutaredoxin family protein [Burkholderiaceae bacterium]
MWQRALVSLLLLAGSAQAQYKWTGPEGQTGYGDQAPRDATNIERMGTSTPSAQADDALGQLPYEVRRAAKDFPVVLYSQVNCAICDDGRAFLKARAIPFSERTIATAEDIAAFRQLGGGEQLPAIAVGRRIVRGYEPSAWGEALTDAGYPQGVSLPKNWQWPAAKPLAPVAPPAAPATEESTDAQR